MPIGDTDLTKLSDREIILVVAERLGNFLAMHNKHVQSDESFWKEQVESDARRDAAIVEHSRSIAIMEQHNINIDRESNDLKARVIENRQTIGEHATKLDKHEKCIEAMQPTVAKSKKFWDKVNTSFWKIAATVFAAFVILVGLVIALVQMLLSGGLPTG